MRKFPLFFLLVLLGIAPLSARAEDAPPPATLLGAGVWLRPAYDGADTRNAVAIPVVRYYGKPWFMRTTFGMLEGGARAELLSGFTLGAQFAYEGGRDSAESAFLSAHNISTIAPNVSLGVHAELEKKIGPMPLIALLRYRQNLEAQRGEQIDLRLTAGILSYGGVNAGIFAQSTWENSKSANYFYGIDAQQSANTGLNAYNASAGELFNALGLLWSYDLNRHWILLGSFERRQLRGSAVDSPLTQINTSQYASLGLAYQF
jgi:outer membrane scaffolding protein for murein synthesis (MipA/OmpV family)